MPAQMFCSFCNVSGVSGPHDHFVRASRDPKSAVTCPRLLATECGFCNRKGHTSKYCGERQYAERQARTATVKANKDAFASGEWMVDGSRKPKTRPTQTQESRFKLTSSFAGLDCDSSDSEQDPEPERSVPTQTGPTWADAVRKAPVVKPAPVVKSAPIEKRPVGMSWADWDEDDE